MKEIKNYWRQKTELEIEDLKEMLLSEKNKYNREQIIGVLNIKINTLKKYESR